MVRPAAVVVDRRPRTPPRRARVRSVIARIDLDGRIVAIIVVVDAIIVVEMCRAAGASRARDGARARGLRPMVYHSW
jgi:hypothetical protein|tara:strand:- start:106 stop:336 length:231 start_codon:yes stop_codon:yes gene_type:complete